MPIINRAADLHDEVAAWRHDFHRHPELLYDVHRTATIVADRLKEFGCDEVVTGLGRTGVVAIIRGRKRTSGKVIGLRADMDALPVHEDTGLEFTSTVPGKMHACGHDGHTAMLLGAAKYLSETRNFDGDVALIFQPAEEGGAGGKAMVDDGLMDRFRIQEVYGLHNMPGIPAGEFWITPGPMLASVDTISIRVTGKGGHGGGGVHLAVDTILVAAQVINALQSVVSRNVDALQSAVLSICSFHSGATHNVIPEVAELTGTVRTLNGAVRKLVEARIRDVAMNTAAAYGARAEVSFEPICPVLVNHAEQTAFAANVARGISGSDKVNAGMAPVMGGEDFAFMLEARPGAFVFLGTGPGEMCHHPRYRFNDEIIPAGISYWARLVEEAMPA